MCFCILYIHIFHCIKDNKSVSEAMMLWSLAACVVFASMCKATPMFRFQQSKDDSYDTTVGKNLKHAGKRLKQVIRITIVS